MKERTKKTAADSAPKSGLGSEKEQEEPFNKWPAREFLYKMYPMQRAIDKAVYEQYYKKFEEESKEAEPQEKP